MGKIIMNGVDYSGEGINVEPYTLLYHNTNFTPTSGTTDVTKDITLSQSIDNFDAVVLIGVTYNDNSNTYWDSAISMFIPKPCYYKSEKLTQDGFMYVMNGSISGSNRRVNFSFTNSTTLRTVARRAESGRECFIWKVYGIKF